MKLKINKAYDLSSISVLPPHARRPVTGGVQTSQFLSQQTSQQSFSQGISVQHGMFSQLSETPSDDFLTNEQRYSSQERDNSLKKVPTLVNYSQEDGRIPLSRNSSNLAPKWNPTSIVDKRCHVSEALEHRVGLIETSLTRFGKILDSVQSDVMQASKGTKEISLELESIRLKLLTYDDSLQQLRKGQEDVKASLVGGFASVSNQLCKESNENKLLEMYLRLSTLPGKIEAYMMKFEDHVRSIFIREMQAFAPMLNLASQKSDVSTLPREKHNEGPPVLQRGEEPSLLKETSPSATSLLPPNSVKKIEVGGWTSVKHEEGNRTAAFMRTENRQKAINSFNELSRQERERRVLADSDEDIEGGFSCLINLERGAYTQWEDDVEAETERILRKARKRKRRQSNNIIINRRSQCIGTVGSSLTIVPSDILS